jgi:hypothetical protein
MCSVEMWVFISLYFSFSSQKPTIFCAVSILQNDKAKWECLSAVFGFSKLQVFQHMGGCGIKIAHATKRCVLQSFYYRTYTPPLLLLKYNSLWHMFSSGLLLKKHIETGFMFVLFESLEIALHRIHDGSCPERSRRRPNVFSKVSDTYAPPLRLSSQITT